MANVYMTTASGSASLDVLQQAAYDIRNGASGGSFTPRMDTGWGDKGFTRYIVSIENVAVIDLDSANRQALVTALFDAVIGARHESRDTPGVFAGYWVDDRKVYIDINRSFDSREEAMTVAAKRGELAIYDTWEDMEIRTELTIAS